MLPQVSIICTIVGLSARTATLHQAGVGVLIKGVYEYVVPGTTFLVMIFLAIESNLAAGKIVRGTEK